MWPSALQMRTTRPSETLFKFCQMTLPRIPKEGILHSHLPNQPTLNYVPSQTLASLRLNLSLQYLSRPRSTEKKNHRKGIFNQNENLRPILNLNVYSITNCHNFSALLYVRCMSRFRDLFQYTERLRWYRDSVLAFGTQVRGFKPGRSRRIFKGEKILSTPSFGGKIKPSVPCRRFAACKISLELRGSRILDKICWNISRPQRVPPSAARGLSRRWT
jgi:hypothetical protein